MELQLLNELIIEQGYEFPDALAEVVGRTGCDRDELVAEYDNDCIYG